MYTAYFDCVAGASGDMLLGALIDAGLPLENLKTELDLLHLTGFELDAEQVQKNGFRATKFRVFVADQKTERHVPEILEIIQSSDLQMETQAKAIEVITRLGKVEAKIHGTDLDHVHLHELGGIDTIVDIVGFILALDLLKIEELIVSPLPLGRGFTQSAHGKIPLPAPATMELIKGVPVYGMEIDKELVTPTGAVLLTALASRFGPFPAMEVSAIGYGAGTRDLPIPNILRVLLGTRETPYSTQIDRLLLLETNIDDMNPEIYEHLMEQLFEAGALDVSLLPVQMKKNRPGTMLQVLTSPDTARRLKQIIYHETTTLGIRQTCVERECLNRHFESVETMYGPVQMKIAELGDGQIKYSPEYEDCRILALKHNVPIQVIVKIAEVAFENRKNS
jgi:uncharacterized protein (TIGR00299 family) protein